MLRRGWAIWTNFEKSTTGLRGPKGFFGPFTDGAFGFLSMLLLLLLLLLLLSCHIIVYYHSSFPIVSR